MSRCAVLAVRADQIPLSPRTRAFSSLLCYSPPPPFSRHVDCRLGAPSSMKTKSLAQAQSLSYRHNLAATRKIPLFPSFNSLLLNKAFDLFPTTSDSAVPRLVTLMALTERGKMDENI